ncbi:MAG: hypothetical protein J6Y58_01080 [Clostridiales bacterium]|nr:hypothetical protein [Clostridiales bacterium]
MIFFYTSFEYSNKATFFAIFMDLLAYGFTITGIVFFILAGKLGAWSVLAGFLFIALAIFFYFFLGKKVGSVIAKKDFKKKIRTNPIVAYNYVNDGRASYDEIAAINPAFAEMYVVNDFGKLTRRKK